MMPGDDEPRWDHHAHYDEAVRLMDGATNEMAMDRAATHALLAIYRLLQERLAAL